VLAVFTARTLLTARANPPPCPLIPWTVAGRVALQVQKLNDISHTVRPSWPVSERVKNWGLSLGTRLSLEPNPELSNGKDEPPVHSIGRSGAPWKTWHAAHAN